jgi:hypothetical protein
LFILWVLCWVLFLMWLVQHVGALPKVIKGPCLVSRGNIYMGTRPSAIYGMPPCHCCDDVEIILWQRTAFCWILKFFYGQGFICIMLCLCYSSFRYLHGESRYTTDSTRVGVTLDYVVVSNHKPYTNNCSFPVLSQLPWCTGLPWGLNDIVLPSLQCQLWEVSCLLRLVPGL